MRRDNVLIFAVLCVFHAWTWSVDSTAVKSHRHRRDPYGSDQTVELSIVDDSVDDMYDGCMEETKKKVNEKYLTDEINKGGIFKEAWSQAEHCAKNVLNRFEKDLSDYNSEELLHNHIKAICAYSAGYHSIHDTFNKAVLSKKNEYSSFEFHSLHFLLTDALHRLKANHGCLKTFRRTKNDFLGEVNKEIRFGFFASSCTDKGLLTFGDKSCFEIETCFGADLKSYPSLGNHEKEVLIPPYEVFKVTAVLKKENDQNLWCDVVYKLQSTRTPKSNLNCNLINIE